jgi:hypothetical protein
VSAELEVLQDTVARLEGAGIAYMLTGSVALSYYAEPRMTGDVDLVVELADRDPKSITALSLRTTTLRKRMSHVRLPRGRCSMSFTSARW